MFKLRIYREPTIVETVTKIAEQLDQQPRPDYIVVKNPEVLDTILDSTGSTFKLTISEYQLPPEPIIREPEVQRTHIDIEKYDRTKPELFIPEVEELIAEGKDFKVAATIGTTVGMTQSEKFYHHFGRIEEKRAKGVKPSFWDIRLANIAVIAMRAGFEFTDVFCTKDHIANGQICDALPDGSQVRILFNIPTTGFEKYKNQRYLANHTAQWFTMPDGLPVDNHSSFLLTKFNTPPRGYTEPGIRC